MVVGRVDVAILVVGARVAVHFVDGAVTRAGGSGGSGDPRGRDAGGGRRRGRGLACTGGAVHRRLIGNCWALQRLVLMII